MSERAQLRPLFSCAAALLLLTVHLPAARAGGNDATATPPAATAPAAVAAAPSGSAQPPPAAEPDAARELAYATAMAETPRPGEVVWLGAEPEKYLALWMEQTAGRPRGAVLLLHDAGRNADWPDVISPLRVGLPAAGWSTLSIQLPVLSRDAPLDAYAGTVDAASTRLALALAYLSGRKVDNIALVGYGVGATIVLRRAVAAEPVPGISGVVLISAVPLPGDDIVAAVEKLTLPLLDIDAASDLPAILALTERKRGAARRAGIERYRYRRVEGASHDYEGQGDQLLAIVRSWLERIAPRGQTPAPRAPQTSG